MKDKIGLYYYPFPYNSRVRMYVSEIHDKICFKFWNANAPEIWDKQSWVPYEDILEATAAYKYKKRNPIEAYDIEAAKQLINEDNKRAGKKLNNKILTTLRNPFTNKIESENQRNAEPGK